MPQDNTVPALVPFPNKLRGMAGGCETMGLFQRLQIFLATGGFWRLVFWSRWNAFWRLREVRSLLTYVAHEGSNEFSLTIRF